MSGKKILVTGGSRGIGRATVLALARSGDDVAFTYSNNQTAAAEVVSESAEMAGRVIAIQACVQDYGQARQVVADVREELGEMDGLILNAGITRDGILAMMPEENWDDVIATNLNGATKAAQIGFVKSLAKEVAAYGITVNAVAPGFIETDIWQSIPAAKHASLLKSIPQGRLGRPEEVAAVVRFLLSEDASYITGNKEMRVWRNVL